MIDRSARKPDIGDRLLEALIELARSAMRTDRDAAIRRATLRIVDGGQRRRDGHAA